MLVHLLRRGLRDRAGGAVVRAQAAADAAQAAGRLERQTVVGAVVRIAGHGDLGRGVGGDAGRELGAEPFDLRAVGCGRTCRRTFPTSFLIRRTRRSCPGRCRMWSWILFKTGSAGRIARRRRCLRPGRCTCGRISWAGGRSSAMRGSAH